MNNKTSGTNNASTVTPPTTTNAVIDALGAITNMVLCEVVQTNKLQNTK